MKDIKHTPSPWEFQEKLGTAYGKDGWAIASVISHNDNGEGDAKLIVAAPDMYEVLKLYEEFEAELITEDGAWGSSNSLPRFTQRLYDKWMEIQSKRNEALAKVRGSLKNTEL